MPTIERRPSTIELMQGDLKRGLLRYYLAQAAQLAGTAATEPVHVVICIDGIKQTMRIADVHSTARGTRMVVLRQADPIQGEPPAYAIAEAGPHDNDVLERVPVRQVLYIDLSRGRHLSLRDLLELET